jgi:hypothetical protein
MTTFEPLKVIYQLIVAEKDGDGDIIAEHLQPPVTLYKPQFAELEERIAATMASAAPIAAPESRPLA